MCVPCRGTIEGSIPRYYRAFPVLCSPMYLRVCWTLNHIFSPVCLGLEQGSEAGGVWRVVAAQAELADTHGGDSRALVYASLFYFGAGVIAE